MQMLGRTDRLDREAWLLLLMSGLFSIASALSGSFVNVYLWKIKNDWTLISWFNVSNYLAGAVTFVLAGWIAKRMERVIAIRLGVTVLSLFYLSVLILGTRSVHYVYLLGVLMGLGSGFFWLAFNVLYFEITEKENRDVFNGVNGFIMSIAGIVAPFVSGLVISRMGHFTGYRLIFGISLAIFIGAMIVSFLFRARRVRGEYQLLAVLSIAKKRDAPWFWVNLAMISQGLREGVFVFLIGLLVYVVVKNEFALGSFFMVQSAVSCFAFFIVSHFMKPLRRYRFILLGSLMMGLVIVPFVWSAGSVTLWILGVGAAFFYPFYMAPLTATVFDVIGATQASARRRVEFVVARELALDLGRIMGILLFIWWIRDSTVLTRIPWVLLLLGFTQLLAWLAIRQVPMGNEDGSKQK